MAALSSMKSGDHGGTDPEFQQLKKCCLHTLAERPSADQCKKMPYFNNKIDDVPVIQPKGPVFTKLDHVIVDSASSGMDFTEYPSPLVEKYIIRLVERIRQKSALE